MIKYFCDWCQKETRYPHGGVFGRRISLKLTDRAIGNMNVCFNLEFPEPKPSHLCPECYVSKVREAVELMASGNPDQE